MNFFKEMLYAVKSPGTYPLFLKNKKFKIFRYGFFLLVIYYILTILVPFAKFEITKGGVSGMVDRYVPEFLYEDGVLWVEEPVLIDDGTNYVQIDTSPEFYLDDVGDYETAFARYKNVLITDGYDLLAKSEGQYYWAALGDTIGPDTYDNASLDSLMPMVNILIASGLFLVFLFELAFFFFGILMLSLIGLIVNSAVKANLTFGQIFIFSIYSRTLSLAIKALVGFLPFGIPFFWVINFGISVLYLYQACKAMKRETAQLEANIVQ